MKVFVLACCLCICPAGWAAVQAAVAPNRADDSSPPISGLPFDPSTPLATRITLPPESVLARYRDFPKLTPVFHELTPAERQEMDTVLEQLPAFTRKTLLQHVRSISFIDGIPGNGVTSLEEGTTVPVFDIVLRAGLLHETVSDYLTRKERGYYSSDPSDTSLSFEGGSLSAVLYVLTHESVHALDNSHRKGKEGPPELFAESSPDLLVHGIWQDARTKMPMYQSPLFQMSWFGSGKKPDLDTAEPTYRVLARTPFVSLYGSSSWYEDVAELVTCYYMTQILKQPYRIVLRKGAEIQYALSPADNPLVRGRFTKLLPLFSQGAD